MDYCYEQEKAKLVSTLVSISSLWRALSLCHQVDVSEDIIRSLTHALVEAVSKDSPHPSFLPQIWTHLTGAAAITNASNTITTALTSNNEATSTSIRSNAAALPVGSSQYCEAMSCHSSPSCASPAQFWDPMFLLRSSVPSLAIAEAPEFSQPLLGPIQPYNSVVDSNSSIESPVSATLVLSAPPASMTSTTAFSPMDSYNSSSSSGSEEPSILRILPVNKTITATEEPRNSRKAARIADDRKRKIFMEQSKFMHRFNAVLLKKPTKKNAKLKRKLERLIQKQEQAKFLQQSLAEHVWILHHKQQQQQQQQQQRHDYAQPPPLSPSPAASPSLPQQSLA